VNPLNHLPTGKVTITGEAKVGETLTASNTLQDEDGLGPITYRWYSGDKLVETGTLLPYGTHATLDVKLHWTTDRYQLFCDLRNVTDSRYFDLGNVEQPGFFVMAGASYTF